MRRLPGRRLKRGWEIVASLSCLYVGFSVPLVLGFGKFYFPDGSCAVKYRALEPWEWTHMSLDIACDAIFLVVLLHVVILHLRQRCCCCCC